jgi:hypothetical protein
MDFRASLDRVGNNVCSSDSAFTLVTLSFLFSRRKDTFSSLSSPLYVGETWTVECGTGKLAAEATPAAVNGAANALKPMNPPDLRDDRAETRHRKVTHNNNKRGPATQAISVLTRGSTRLKDLLGHHDVKCSDYHQVLQV